MTSNFQIMLRMHKSSIAVILFLIVFSIIHYLKPGVIYGDAGEFRPFGVGYLNKTVIPGWAVAILIAILSYTFVLYLSRT